MAGVIGVEVAAGRAIPFNIFEICGGYHSVRLAQNLAGNPL
jgi:hypothetical protein